jgi:hypothetical protein
MVPHIIAIALSHTAPLGRSPADWIPASYRPGREKHTSLVLSDQTPNPQFLYNTVKGRP